LEAAQQGRRGMGKPGGERTIAERQVGMVLFNLPRNFTLSGKMFDANR
jgi:hypothetical protein